MATDILKHVVNEYELCQPKQLYQHYTHINFQCKSLIT